MSDDEGDDGGEYEEDLLVDEPAADGDGDALAPGEDGAESDLGLDEDAAGSEGPDEEGSSSGDEAPPTEADSGARARPAPPRVDPILRASNRATVIGVIPPHERTSDHRLQKGEATLIIAMRAQEIARAGTHFAKEASHLTDPVAIAYQELFERRTPLYLTRRMGTGPGGEASVEEWSPREMTLPTLDPPASWSPAPKG